MSQNPGPAKDIFLQAFYSYLNIKTLMRFLIRSVEFQDADALFHLANRAALFSLIPDRQNIQQKIDVSLRSFQQTEKPDEAEFIFVIEDLRHGKLIGSSQIIPHYISQQHPHYVFRVQQHKDGQVLKLHKYTGGKSLLCGLVIDPDYRRRPDQLGRQVSLSRLLFAGIAPEYFEPSILGELLPPLDQNKKNPFWEELGKIYSGLSYEAALERVKKRDLSFIEKYFPKDDIFLPPEKSSLHRNRDTVFPPTIPSRHIIEKQGLRYLEEVHPVDGALEYGVEMKKIRIIQNGQWLKSVQERVDACTDTAFAGVFKNQRYRGGSIQCRKKGGIVGMGESTLRHLGIRAGEQVYISSI